MGVTKINIGAGAVIEGGRLTYQVWYGQGSLPVHGCCVMTAQEYDEARQVARDNRPTVDFPPTLHAWITSAAGAPHEDGIRTALAMAPPSWAWLPSG